MRPASKPCSSGSPRSRKAETPIAGVFRDAAGNLIGTTYEGGTSYFVGLGTVFKVDSKGRETVLHTFAPTGDGAFPYGGVLPYGEDLYGMTTAGGAFDLGTVFKLDKAGNETILYSFVGGTDGEYPNLSGLIHDASGNLYGTTENGGDSNNDGTVFELDQAGNETVLHRFTGADGSRPLRRCDPRLRWQSLRHNIRRRCSWQRHGLQDRALNALPRDTPPW
jgi:uncharacterized repeat protein (TIGR03803 family)